jgi:oligopeptide/dipeptide ABC transporter ATP-binding protein
VSRASSLLNRPVLRAFRTAPSGLFGLLIVLTLAVVAAIAPEIWRVVADTQNFTVAGNQPPSWHHLLGTDQVGRDVFLRLLVATRLSLQVALTSAALALSLGIVIGTTAALSGPRLRPILLRVIDTLLSFPSLLTAIFVSVIIGQGRTGATVAVGVALSFGISRITSTLALSVGGREYINAARVLGVRGPRLMFRYVLPNIAEPLIIAFSVVVGVSIVLSSALSFLGLGVQLPDYDWGGMLTNGVKAIYLTPAAALGPAAAIAISALAFGFLGEALARALNPLLWTSPKRRTVAASGAAAQVEDDAHEPLVAATAAMNGRTPAALDVRDLVVSFPGADGPAPIVKGVSFSVQTGEVVGLVGESGSGKTMTALTIAQLTPFPGRVDGTISLEGRDIRSVSGAALDALLGTKLAVVFQDPMSSLNPALKIGTQMTHAMRVHRGLNRKQARDLAVESLTVVHIPAAERQIERFPHEFSGGMRQRAMIAMGLMKKPTLLLADEPTTALDVTIQAQIMDLLDEVNREHGTSVVLISHNLALISQTCDRVLVMYAGRVVEELDAEQLVHNPMHPYTRALLEAVPKIGQPRDEPLAYIPGEMPDITSPPPGCPFHPRCSLAREVCSIERPALLRRPDDRRVACHVANEDLAAIRA